MDYDIDRDTLASLFVRRVACDGDRTAVWTKHSSGYASLTWNEVGNRVRQFATALVALGVNPGDRIIQVSENRLEWIIADLAILLVRGVHVPVHASLTGPQIAYQIADSGARVVLVSTPEQVAKLPAALQGVSAPVRVVAYESCQAPEGVQEVLFLSDLIARSDPDDRLERAAVDALRPDDLATILYTSGTTGEPKGVMLSHRNLVSNAVATMSCFTMSPEDLRLTWLPLSHIFARTCDLYAWIACGSQLALAESRETILANCGELAPTLLNGVPYFFDKVMRVVVEKGLAETPGCLQKMLGGRMRFLCSGGAALPDHVARFFQERGMLLVQGYGLSETSPVITCNTDASHRLGTVGKAIPGVEVRIAGDGEILTRGPHVMPGYWKKTQATAETIRDGWLHTGDLGSVDADGFLKITGRKKELIVLASGKNIAPVYLESLLTEDARILQAVVIGDGQNYLTALLAPNFDTLKTELAKRGLQYTFPAEWLDHETVRTIYADCVAERLKDVSHPEQVRKFTLLERPFTPESGELTPTLKLRRGVIAHRYAAEIAAMYQGDAG